MAGTGHKSVGGQCEYAERAAIEEAFTRNVVGIGGPNGAAARLGLRRTTLIGKMKRLNISHPALRQNIDIIGTGADTSS